MQTTYTKMT